VGWAATVLALIGVLGTLETGGEESPQKGWNKGARRGWGGDKAGGIHTCWAQAY